MDISSLLWLVWFVVLVVGFYVLERLGLRSSNDTWFTLTNRIRLFMGLNRYLRALIYAAIALLAIFLLVHFAVDPLTNPGH